MFSSLTPAFESIGTTCHSGQYSETFARLHLETTILQIRRNRKIARAVVLHPPFGLVFDLWTIKGHIKAYSKGSHGLGKL